MIYGGNITLIPGSLANVLAAPPTSDPSYIDPAAVFSNKTYLFQDNEAGSWTVSFGFAFSPMRLILRNAFIDGRGTKDFSLTALSTGGLANLTYEDFDTGDQRYCSSSCPLPEAKTESAGFSAYYFVNYFEINSFRIDILDWYGPGAGLSGLQLYGTPDKASDLSSAAASSTASQASTPATPAPTANSSDGSSGASTTAGLSTGAIAGIVVSVIVAILAVVAVLLFLRRRRRRTKARDSETYKPPGGRYEVDTDKVDQTKNREELDAKHRAELDVPAQKAELSSKGLQELPGVVHVAELPVGESDRQSDQQLSSKPKEGNSL